MKSMNIVSFSMLLLSGLVLMILGARIGSAPDVFAFEIGAGRMSAEDIAQMALNHAGTMFGLGLFAVAAAFASSRVRWLGLGLLIGLGAVAWFTVWQFDAATSAIYAPVLKTLLFADGLGFMAITARRDADRAGPQADELPFYFRWG